MVDSPERDTDEVDRATLTLMQKLHGAASEMSGHLDKDATHTIKKDGKKVGEFDYITHDSITDHIRRKLLDWRVMSWPSVVEQAQNGNRTELTIDITFVNVDNAEDTATTRAVGYGVDNQDKGPGKAYTYAVKAAYLKIFMLNSADDIESESIDHDPAIPRQSQVTAAEGKATDAQIAFAQSYKQSIDATQSLEALEELEKANRHALKDMPEATQKYFKDQLSETKKQMEEI